VKTPNVTPSTTPEVHNVSQSHQRKAELQVLSVSQTHLFNLIFTLNNDFLTFLYLFVKKTIFHVFLIFILKIWNN